jgi:hypothetical protein
MATAPVRTPPLPLGAVRAFRHPLAGGAATTVHVAVYERSRVALRVIAMDAPEPLAGWCARSGVEDALVGGFFVTPVGTPLGELWIGGARRASVPFDPPWGAGRSGLAVDGGLIRIDGRPGLPSRPAGDLLQAGPLLVRGGRAVVRDGEDPEGFSAGRAQFDSDIADGRHPRAALGVSDAALIAVVCDGRAEGEAGLSLGELAGLMAQLGAVAALNLDGGGSAALVAGGCLRNVPREAWGREIPGGRPIATALTIRPRPDAERAAGPA